MVRMLVDMTNKEKYNRIYSDSMHRTTAGLCVNRVEDDYCLYGGRIFGTKSVKKERLEMTL